ncbi:hypothetical protein I3843_12G101000 [Carya illinoinensis]|uniref:Cytochrome P450 n=1 Tax=Carya illinoinensis TaxID=32201 RepID=A0A922DIZ6_CARIL|nr:hypothetical protein I3760_12G099000 [Carya illinoinensis]KAG6685200.1 hypothetical protein I3842_12G100400 [Carya illinoinensis]KAG7953264.1 hypothetical protein I3843_12G101000 [Carya illinoinensis]
MDFLSSIIYLCLAWTLIQTFRMFARSKAIPRKLPPGPKPFPVIGNLFDLAVNKPYNSIVELAQIYGPIMSLKLGQVTTVIISSEHTAKQVLQTHDQLLSNRTVPDALRVHKHDEHGLPWMPISAQWRNLRKICNGKLFANKILDSNQAIRYDRVQALLSEIRQSSLIGEAVDIGRAASKTALSLLSNTIFSVDWADPNSDTAREFKETARDITTVAGKPNLVDLFPLLKKIDPQGVRHRMAVHLGKLMDIFDRMISERLQLRKVSGYITNKDMLDTLLNISEENGEEMDKAKMKSLFLNLFVGGTDTTSATLEWAMAELLHHPDVVSKAKAELEQVIGRGNPVEESDITRLPYLQAVIKETFRLHPALPFLIPRKAEADVEVDGYVIPKGARVLVNAWGIGRDPSIWENANSFMPERFLGSEIDVKGRHFELIPFGGGRRICPGMPLAMRMLNLMLGSLIHNFDWKLEDGVKIEDISMEGKFGLTYQIGNPVRVVPIPI